MLEVREDAGALGVPRLGVDISQFLGEKEAIVGNMSKTPSRRRKMKGLSELRVSNTHPRKSVRISTISYKVGNTSQTREGTISASISDGDIVNCNLRLCNPEILVEPSKLWEIGRQAGITCHEDEQEVVKEFLCMEERDLEIMKCSEEGNKNGLL